MKASYPVRKFRTLEKPSKEGVIVDNGPATASSLRQMMMQVRLTEVGGSRP